MTSNTQLTAVASSQSAIPVVDNVPIPSTAHRMRRGDYPFEKLGVGSSFWARRLDGMNMKTFRKKLSVLCGNYARSHDLDWTFVTAVEGDGVRVWRRS